ncbi:MAG: 4-phosphoerythronate dehydrogenase [Candidatus Omnitrophica bacterium]|nr:4-phosphoerythronate dehydrogenase [Candidatus Omnitrophota bacterium]
MRLIVFDENIPYGAEAFSKLGRTVSLPGRGIRREDLAEAEILIVRSITRVNRDLLEGTPVRFVGTATIGTDHIDLGYLRDEGIAFSDAAGCNANSVSEYVTAAILHLEKQKGVSFVGKTAGIIGVGNVGKKVEAKLSALGMRVLLNDPPRAEKEGSERFTELGTLLRESDLLTVHTPLEKSGNHPTYHLIGSDEIERMKPSAFLFNTSRGAVVDGVALLSALKGERIAGAVLDVWENEPTPNLELLEKVELATPHIAGYSLDGKINGTRIMFEAAARFLGVHESWDEAWNPPVEKPEFSLKNIDRDSLREAVFHAYAIHEDDARMREILNLREEERGPFFDRLRKEYPVRREFQNYQVEGGDTQTLKRLGFQTTE